MMMLPMSLSSSNAVPGPNVDLTSRPPDVLRRIREALGDASLRLPREGLLLSGDAVHFAAPASFTLQFTPDGRFRRETSGPLGEIVGFDGRSAWYVDSSGMALSLVLEQRELALLATWVQTGHWLAAEVPVVIGQAGAEEAGAGIILTIRLRDGVAKGRLTIHPETLRPVSLSVPTTLGEQIWRYEDYHEFKGVLLPHRMTHSLGPLADSYEVRVAGAPPTTASERFLMPTSRPQDTRFGLAPARLDSKRTPTGHILVRPLVNGRDLGWFILDTGAGLGLITPEAAEAARMEAFGQRGIAGAGPGKTVGAYRSGRTFELGPVAIDNFRYVEMDLGPLAAAMGAPLAGVVGYDLLSRVVVQFDRGGEIVQIHDPERYRLRGGTWQNLILHGNHPHVRARFGEEREGLFRIDTGGGPAQVIFHAPAVERWSLLEGKDLRSVRLGGAGGMFEAKVGTIDWLEVGGLRIERPTAILALPGSGALDDPYTEGTFGWGIFGRFMLVLDYPHRRLALVSR